jgi:methyl-accepting chemotaxis protein
MAIGPSSNEQPQEEISPVSSDFQNRTFMGGIGVGTRSSLFTILGLAVLVGSGFGLLFANKELTKAEQSLNQAVELSAYAVGIERDIWRIRAESKELAKQLASHQSATNDAEIAATQEHIALANSVGLRLDNLYKRLDATPVGEQISTLREAVAQYIEQYDKSGKESTAPVPDLVSLETSLRQSMRKIGQTLTDINILSLNETITAIRAATTEFIESGASRDLAVIETHENGFSRLLSSVPISDEIKVALQQNLATNHTSLTAYAKVRLVRDNSRDRLDEIISYMLPSVDAITGFAGDNQMQAQSQRQSLHQRYRVYIASGFAGGVIVIMLFGLAMLRSISGPIRAAAIAGRKLKDGNTDIVVKGLGNEDETGDIARAFWTLKSRLGEANKIRDTIKKAKAEAERGRAASAEAEWLRRDLESMKSEADKGRNAIAEVALLRKVIDATSDSIGRNQNPGNNDAVPVASPLVEQPPPTKVVPDFPLDSISSISRQVAQSSQSVTAAADEAERTGTLIRNLSDAEKKIDGIDKFIAAIAEQADMLVVNTPPQEGETNLVILNGDGNKDAHTKPDVVSRRFDAIRSAAGQATWAVRDIGALIKNSREVALDIARLSSAEALEVTTDLLQQSENLRCMLDNLVNKMQHQITDHADGQAKEEDGPNIA